MVAYTQVVKTSVTTDDNVLHMAILSWKIRQLDKMLPPSSNHLFTVARLGLCMHLLEDVRFGIKYGVIVSALLKTLASYCTEVVHMTSFLLLVASTFIQNAFLYVYKDLRPFFIVHVFFSA